MSTATTTLKDAAWPSFRQAPGRFTGTALLVFLRLFYGLFFFQAGVNKMLKGWGYASYLAEVFAQRLTELNPDSFASLYLENFGIPFATPISFVVAWGELFAGIGLLLGLATRPAAILAFFILFNIAIGGYYDASLLPFFAMNIAFIFYPLGRKFGLDRYLHPRFPDSFLFR
jgi:thiosulfate dehydrogenase [quinone] large subunit